MTWSILVRNADGRIGHPELSVRVDDSVDPLTELQRLQGVGLQHVQPFIACLPGRHDPVGELDRDRIEARIAQFHKERS